MRWSCSWSLPSRHMITTWWALALILSVVLPPPSALAAPNVRTKRIRRQEPKESFLGFERPEPAPINPIQRILYNYLEPKPIVDSIREEDKYGNEGDVLGSVGRGLVSGTETLTTFISSTVSVPGNIARRLLKRVSDSLNNVGSRIVGLK